MDIRKFLHQHGLGQYSEEKDDAKRTEELLIQREKPGRMVYCKGCGKPLMDYNTYEGESERNFGMHMSCFREAIQKMERLREQFPDR